MFAKTTFSDIRDSIASKFAVAIFTFSLIGGTLVTMVYSAMEFQEDKNNFIDIIENIHVTTESTLATALWLTNEELVLAVIEGIAAIPGIERVEVTREDNSSLRRGEESSTRLYTHSHQLNSSFLGEQVVVGKVTIVAGFDHFYRQLPGKIFKIMAIVLSLSFSCGILTFLLFYGLVGRHLTAVAQYSGSIQLEKLGKPFELKRYQADREDELDSIVVALNKMRSSLRSSLNRIRERDLRYEKIVTGSSDPILTLTQDGAVLYANPRACQLFELDDTRLSGKTLKELRLPRELARVCRGVMVNAGQLTGIVARTIELETSEGVRSFDLQFFTDSLGDGSQVSMVTIARDVTSHRQAESILRRAFTHMPMMMAISEFGTNAYLEVNDKFIEISGFDRTEIIGASFADLKLIPDAVRKGIEDVIENKGFIENFPITIQRKDGQVRECLYFAERIKVDGQAKRLCLVQDVTEQNRTIADRNRLERQMNQSVKMEAIGTLAGGIAHDFNNILSAILGYAEIAMDRIPAGHPVHDDLQQIYKGGERAAGLVKQILTFSRQDQEDFRPFRVRPIIEEVVKLLQSTLPATIEINTDILGGGGTVLGDPSKIHQVLMNICTNARQAIGSVKGSIHIRSELVGLQQTEHGWDGTPIPAGDYILVEIRDTGSGIPPAIQSRIFDPFYSTKRQEQGTGLGLAVTHGIVAKHNGMIALHSQPGMGTTFSIFLPVHHQAPSPEINRSGDLLEGTEHILLVDDEEMLVDITERSLVNLGYRVTSFTRSPEALEFFRCNTKAVDIVVTDMTMPDLSGLDITRQMRLLRPELPVIICTGYSEIMNDVTAKSHGINSFILKPVITKNLSEQIRMVLDS